MYTITLSGQGDVDDVRGVFEDTVRALRAVATDGTAPSGSMSAQSDDAGAESLTLNASDVVDVEAVDTAAADGN